MLKLKGALIGALVVVLALGAVVWATEIEQELIVGVTRDPGEARWAYLGGITPYGSGIFETLVYLAPDMTAHPGLATSWEQLDETTWRLYLREGVRFHSGKPFDAEAAKLTLETIRDEGFAAWLYIESVAVVFEHTIDVHTTMPFAAFPEHLTHAVVAMANFDQEGELAPDGTGPFKFLKHVAGVETVVVKNEDYWGEKPALERIVYKIIPDHTTRVLALRAGEIDLMLGVPMADVSILEADPTIDVYRKVTPRVHFLTFTLFKEPVTDVLVRRAIAHAIEKDLIVDFVLEGFGEVARSIIVPQMPWSIHSETDGYPYDPGKCSQLLAEAGWTDTDNDGIVDKEGKPLSITMIVGVLRPEYIPIAEAVQGMLREVGIDLQLEVLEHGAWIKAFREGVHEMALYWAGTSLAEGDYAMPFVFHSSGWANAIAPVMSLGEHVDAAIDGGLGTFDREERYEIYRGIQWTIEEEVVGVPLYYVENIIAAGTHVRGFEMHSTEVSQDWRGVYILR